MQQSTCCGKAVLGVNEAFLEQPLPAGSPSLAGVVGVSASRVPKKTGS